MSRRLELALQYIGGAHYDRERAQAYALISIAESLEALVEHFSQPVEVRVEAHPVRITRDYEHG